MKNALYVLRYAKRHVSSWIDVEQWKNRSLSFSCLRLSEAISYSVSQSVTRKFHLIVIKFHSNLLKAFRVDLKAFLGLVLPNQYCLIVIREKWGWFFWVMFIHVSSLHLCVPYYTVLSYCMIFHLLYTGLQMMNSMRNASAIDPVLMKISDWTCAQTINYWNTKWPFHFSFSYIPPVIQSYKWRTVREVPLQSIQSHCGK